MVGLWAAYQGSHARMICPNLLKSADVRVQSIMHALR